MLTILLTSILLQAPPPAVVAGIPVNYDELKTGAYQLPDPLKLTNGKPVHDAKTWFAKRRPEIVQLFEENQFGKSPGRPATLAFDVFEKAAPAFGGKAIRRQITIRFGEGEAARKWDVLLYLPAGANKPSPVLLNASFSANSTTVDDPGVKPGEFWNREKKRVPAPATGIGKLNVLPLIEQGFAVATVYYGDIDPDFAGGFPYGVRSTYPIPGPGDWGTISAWAWGLSRVLDYLETDHEVNAARVTLMGISRLGKTVLWTAAHDTRFASVIASCSGEGGAALSRRNYGETIQHLAVRYGYQFAPNYAKYGEHVDQFPVDANLLISLIAPRPLLLQTGDKDFWSDPKGEFLAAQAAAPVYKLLGKPVSLPAEFPAPGQALLDGTLNYFMHSGGHGTIPSDWDVFLKFLTANAKE